MSLLIANYGDKGYVILSDPLESEVTRQFSEELKWFGCFWNGKLYTDKLEEGVCDIPGDRFGGWICWNKLFTPEFEEWLKNPYQFIEGERRSRKREERGRRIPVKNEK